MDDQTLIFYEPVTWGYFSPMQHNEIFDMLLTETMDFLSIFNIKEAISQLCGPMESNLELEKPASKHDNLTSQRMSYKKDCILFVFFIEKKFTFPIFSIFEQFGVLFLNFFIF